MEISLFLKKQGKMVQHISDFRVFHIKTDPKFQTYVSLLIPEFMKKYALICLLFLAQSTFAGSIKDIFKEFKKTENAEYVHIPKFIMRRAAISSEDDEFMRHIKEVRILTLDKCDEEKIARFLQKTKELEQQGYDPYVKTKEDDENMSVLIKEKRNTIREVVLVMIDGQDLCLIQVEGKFKMEDISGLSVKVTPLGHGDKRVQE